MKRISILNNKTARRAKALGQVGEDLAPSYLKSVGFDLIHNLNEVKNNQPFFDLRASRNGVTYVISIKARNKFEARTGNLNARYKLVKRDRLELMHKTAENFAAVPAWLAIQIDEKEISIYFGTLGQLADKTGISMTPDAIRHYECLAKNKSHTLDIGHLKNTYETRSTVILESELLRPNARDICPS